MYSTLFISALSGLALVHAQSEATPNPTIPAMPTSTVGIPTIEGALVYDGPPVLGYTGSFSSLFSLQRNVLMLES